MIITLMGADFSKSNIGTLSTWRISRSLGTGATYEGPTSVDKGASLSATIFIADGYEISSSGVAITMGGVNITEYALGPLDNGSSSVHIPEVTGNVLIKVPTINTATGEEEEPEVPDTPDEPVEPTVGWFSNQIEQPELTTPIDLTSAPYGYTDALCASYYNKPINKIRLKVAQAGTVSFGVCSADRKNIISTYTINAVIGTDEYDVPETFTLEEGQGIWWQKKEDTGKSYCTIKANDKTGTFYSNIGLSNLVQPHDKNYSLGFDLGYFN
jgi:hypothetical protein